MGMKIAVTSAYSWPYMRRGNRCAYELAVYLGRLGHQVHFITTKPGSISRKKVKEMVLVEYHRIMAHPLLSRFKIDETETYVLPCLLSLLREDFDIVQTTFPTDAFAASLNKSIKGTHFVHLLYGCEPLYPNIALAKPMFSRVVRRASRLLVISKYINNDLIKEFGVEGILIPLPVDTSKFFPAEMKDLDPPRILCTAALTTRRKRIPLLVKAFERLIEHVPHAILQLAGQTTPGLTRNLLMSVNSKTRRAIEILNITSDEALASLYRSATISVIPSLKEPFGMVTTESLASGTVVVGTRSGAIPEILDDPRVGVLFEPTDGPIELCEALLKGLELAHDPQTPKRCRQHAERYAWNRLGPQYEKLYLDILDGQGRKGNRLPKRVLERKMLSSSMSNQPVPSQGQVGKSALSRVFDDTLDEREITYDTYYEIESYRPRCLYILNWLLTNGIHNGIVLVLSTYPRPLSMLFERLGFRVREIVVNQGLKTGKGAEGHEIFPAPQMLVGLEESFDVMVCDDLLQHLVSPVRTLQVLKERLGPKGVLILTSPNVARGVSRLRLLIGRNIYRCLQDSMVSGGSLGENIQQPMFYREYTLREVEDLVSGAGFAVLEKRCFIGKRTADHYFPMTHMPITTYLSWQIYYNAQRVIPPLRSHLFVAARKISPESRNSRQEMFK